MNPAGQKSTRVPGKTLPIVQVPSVTGQQVRPVTEIVSPKESATNQWTFLTNHSHVIVLLSRNPNMVLREVALQVGITERAVQRVICDLEAGGVIERERVGRQNHYRIRTDQPLRHPLESHRTIGELLDLLNTMNARGRQS